MNKKLIISESQYEKLRFLILETEFDKMADNVIDNNDVIKILANKNVLSFKVINNTNGQIYMENIDSGTEYFGKLVFLSSTSFNDNILELKVANDKQKDEKPYKPSAWMSQKLKNVEKIDVYRNNKLIDSTEEKDGDKKNQGQPEEKLPDEALDNINELLNLLLKNLKSNKGLTMIMSNNEEVNFCCQSESNGTFVLELVGESPIELLSNFDSITMEVIPVPEDDEQSDLYSKNKENWSTTDNGRTVNVIVVGNSGSDTQKIKITGISDMKIDNTCLSDEKKDEDKDEEDDGLDSENMVDMLANDPQLRDAFYKRPTFWQSFMAELKGEKPKTTGYTVVKNLLDRYADDKVAQTLGKNFVKKADIVFRPLDKIVINYSQNGQSQTYSLNTNDEIDDMRYIKSQPSKSTSSGNEYSILLSNKDIDVLVNKKTNTPNVYLCDVIKKYTEKVKGKNVIKYSKPDKDVRIEFIDSPGYRVDKKEKK